MFCLFDLSLQKQFQEGKTEDKDNVVLSLKKKFKKSSAWTVYNKSFQEIKYKEKYIYIYIYIYTQREREYLRKEY